MNKTIEAKGDTIDAAIQKGLQLLGKDRDDVSVEVVHKPKSGFLGIGREPAVVRVSYQTSPADTAKDFLEGLLVRFGTPARVDMVENPEERNIQFELSGENMGAVIGHHGDTLDAIQYLTTLVANRNEEERWRVIVDTENYRAKRESTLEALAKRTAQKALKYKKNVAFEPMNPHERRIIHATLQDVEGVTTYSTGSEPNRRVIVSVNGAPSGNNGEARTGSRPPRRRGSRGGQRRQGQPRTEEPGQDNPTEVIISH